MQTSFQAFRGGFLVTDGHLNRMLQVSLDGDISVFRAFENIVPVGLETWGNTIYLAEAGPLPHLPADGKIVSFTPGSSTATVVAAGGPLLVDVERGRGTNLYGLAQGTWPPGTFAGNPALPNTGQLLRVTGDGAFTVIASGLNQPLVVSRSSRTRRTSSRSAGRSGRSRTSPHGAADVLTGAGKWARSRRQRGSESRIVPLRMCAFCGLLSPIAFVIGWAAGGLLSPMRTASSTTR